MGTGEGFDRKSHVHWCLDGIRSALWHRSIFIAPTVLCATPSATGPPQHFCLGGSDISSESPAPGVEALNNLQEDVSRREQARRERSRAR